MSPSTKRRKRTIVDGARVSRIKLGILRLDFQPAYCLIVETVQEMMQRRADGHPMEPIVVRVQQDGPCNPPTETAVLLRRTGHASCQRKNGVYACAVHNRPARFMVRASCGGVRLPDFFPRVRTIAQTSEFGAALPFDPLTHFESAKGYRHFGLSCWGRPEQFVRDRERQEGTGGCCALSNC
jgi:hypothetical protein